MTRLEHIALWAAGTTLAAFLVYGSFGLCRHAIEALDAIKDTAHQTQPVLANVTAVTNSVRDSSKTQADNLIAIERDVRTEMWDLNRTLLTTRGTLTAAQGAFAGVQGTLTHANGTMDAATSFLGSAQTQVTQNGDSLTATMEQYTANGASLQHATDDLDNLLKSQAVNDIPVQVDFSLVDFNRILNKTANDFTSKKPWYRKYPSLAFDAGGFVLRHY
jgi:ABC-type transporter Mla subunit MlaD